MAFAMTSAERLAANDAMGHAATVSEFHAFFLWAIGVAAIVWLFFQIMGVWEPVKKQQKNIADAIMETAVAMAVVTCVGILVAIAL